MNIDRTKKYCSLFFANRVKACVLLLICSSFSLGAVDAGTVTNENNTGLGSLRQVILDASPGDTIDFDSGVSMITLNGFIEIKKNLTIDGPNVTISGNNNVQIFKVESATVQLKNLTFIKGRGLYGGAVYSNDSTVEAIGCTFSENIATGYAGAVFNDNVSALIATDCTFHKNSASIQGGAVYNNTNSAITATACTFSENIATSSSSRGGAIYNGRNSTLEATGCIFSENSAKLSGAIYNFDNTTITTTDCTFSGNSATNLSSSEGGAINNKKDVIITATNCIFSGNSARLGGAIYNAAASVLTATDCTFSENIATGTASLGGAIYNTISTVEAASCTFSGNSAMQTGGALFNNNVSTITATDCIFSGNSARSGGAVGNSRSVLTATDCTFSGNIATGSTSSNGGAIYNYFNSEVTVTDCTFSENSTTLSGGAIYNSQSTVEASSSTFSRNSTTTGTPSNGGAIYNYANAEATVTDCTFSENSTTLSGGAIYNYSSSTITATDCTFSGNSAATGGAIYNYANAEATVTDCTFSGNSAINGGVMYNIYGSTITAANCTFSGNSAASFGGAMFNSPYFTYTSTIEATNCTFSGNSAMQTGGAIYTTVSGTLFYLNNSIVAGNTAPAGSDGDATIISNGHNFIGNASGINGVLVTDKTFANTSTTLSDLLETQGPEPLLKNNGGVTDTIALVSGSPAINSGDNAAVVGINYDQRGVGFPRILYGVVDIGAYESAIRTPLQKTNDLIAEVLDLGLSTGTQQSLLSKLFDVELELNHDPIHLAAACDDLKAFTNYVSAQSGKKIDSVDADMLIAQANDIKADLKCPLNTLECR